MAQYTDDPALSGGGGDDWFAQNAPPAPAAAPAAGAGPATSAQVAALYQELTGRPPENDQVVQQWIQGTGGDLTKIRQGMAATPEAQAFASHAASSGQSSGGAPTLDTKDPASVAAYVSYYAGQPGANPSLKNDPNYWIQKISSGELGTDPKYIIGKFMLPEGAPAAGGQYGGAAQANFGAPPSPYAPPTYTPPAAYVAPTYTAPTWQGGAPPTAPTLAQYTPPTQAELEASPGYLARMKADQVAQERSAASRGSVLNGGFQVALARRQGELASGEYGNLVAQGQATTGLNNAATQTEFGDTFSNYLARYGQFTDAAAMGKNAFDTNAGNAYTAYVTNQGIDKNAFDTNAGNQYQAYQTNVSNTRNNENDYWSRLNDLYTAGLSAANNSYKPGVTL